MTARPQEPNRLLRGVLRRPCLRPGAGRVFPLLAAIILTAGCWFKALPSLDPLPSIPSAIDAAARGQLVQQQQRTEASLQERDAVAAGFDFGRLGQLYHAYGLLDPAIVCYRNATRLLPDDANWWHYQGLAYRQRGDHAAAVESMRRGLEVRPNGSLLRLHLAESEIALGNYDNARAEAELLLDDSPYAAAGHLILGRVALATDQADLAVRDLLRVLELQPQATQVNYTLGLALREGGRLQEAQHHLSLQGPIGVAFPDPLADQLAAIATTPWAHLRRGNQALLANRLEEAKVAFEAAVAGAPDSPEARRNLALALLRLGDGESAAEHLEAAVEFSTDDAGLFFDLGNARFALNQPDAAIAAFRKALALAPGFGEARFNLANALLRAGRWKAAQRELETVVAQRPGHTQARYQLAMMPVQLGDPAKSERLLKAMLEVEPRSVMARVGLAEVLGLRGATDVADDRLQEAFELARPGAELAEVLQARARLALAADDPTAAIGYAQQGLEERPGDAEARRVLAEGLALVGSWVEARRHLEQIAGDPRAALALAKLLAAAPDSRVRDGARSQAIARQLVEARPTIEHGEVYAMALAEVGQIADATALAERLVKQARKAGLDSNIRARLELELNTYRAGKPYRLNPGLG